MNVSRGGSCLLSAEVGEDLFCGVAFSRAVAPAVSGLPGGSLGACVALVLATGSVEVADQEDPGPAGPRLQVWGQLLADAGADLWVPAAFDLDDDGEWLGGGVAGVGGLDEDVRPAAVEAAWLDFDFTVDHRLLPGQVLSQERTEEVGQVVLPGRPPAVLGLLVFPVPHEHGPPVRLQGLLLQRVQRAEDDPG